MNLRKNPPAPVRGIPSQRHFCPRCGAAGRDQAALCRECGEAMAPQGYCPVCESHWTLAPGSPCPKHDLELEHFAPEEAAGPVRCPAAGEPWTTVGLFGDALRAEAPRIRLEAEGIPTFLDGERMGSPSMYYVATGGVKLQVPASLAADARILLAQSWSTPEADDLDDAWDDLAPNPAAPWRDAFCALVFLVMLAPLLLAVLAYCLGTR
jgi:hypothetical protein